MSSGFNGNIGSDAEPLEINCHVQDIVIDGGCTMYLKLSAGTGADAGCGRLVVNNEKANVSKVPNLKYITVGEICKHMGGKW